MTDAIDEIGRLETPLILFVGSDVPTSAGLPSRRQLAEALLKAAEDQVSPRQLEELRDLLAESELAALFSEMERALTPAGFGRVVERTLDDSKAVVPPLASALAKLRPRLRGVITNNLDHLLEQAFQGMLTVYSTPVADLPQRRDWLLKVNGTLRDRSTWVLTQEQRADAMVRGRNNRDVLRSLFLAHPILFVGMPVDDDALAGAVEHIQAVAGDQPPQHWALIPAKDAGPVRRRKLAAAGIEAIPYEDEADRAAMLARLAGAPTDQSATAPATPAPAHEVTPPAAAPPPTASAPRTQPQAPPSPAAASPPPSPVAAASSGQRSILFLAANPAGTDPLRLDRELRIIREAIERSRGRDSLRLEIRLAATVHDLRRALLDAHYDVVHVSGHGEQEGLILEDERGDCVQVPRQAVARLFGRYAPPEGRLQCVVLNACWTLSTGESTAMDVPFTVAMDGPISDAGAMEFSRGFYDALGAGRDYADAYAEGRSCVELAAPDARFDSVLLKP